jgi:hypothetical protein
MRYALLCVMSVAALAAPEGATTPPPSSEVAVILNFEGPQPRAVREMERETEQILKGSGVRLSWTEGDHAAGGVYSDLVVVRFRGNCSLNPEPPPPLYDERGPLASTFTTDEEVQPFAEVACEKISALMRPAMKPSDFSMSDKLMGRALGRVLAHELVHMLTRSTEHGHGGVAEPALSGKQLLSPRLSLEAADLKRLSLQTARR